MRNQHISLPPGLMAWTSDRYAACRGAAVILLSAHFVLAHPSPTAPHGFTDTDPSRIAALKFHAARVFRSIELEAELGGWEREIETWTNPDEIAAYREVPWSDTMVQGLYIVFQETVVTPPEPDEGPPCQIPNATNAMIASRELCKRIHNTRLALPGKLRDRYDQLLELMMGTLFVGYRHIPYAIEGDRPRVLLWYMTHRDLVGLINQECARLFAGQERADEAGRPED